MTGYYNRRTVLERTIRSILDQDFEDLEILVFDDASTDGTADELARLSDHWKDPRFRFVSHSTNLGFTRGLIAAINDTSGEYIAIQGSGDLSYPARLRMQARLLDDNPEVGAVGCWVRETDEDGRTLSIYRPDASRGNRVPFSHGEVMIRRSTYLAAGGYQAEFVHAQDLDLWPRIGNFSRLATVPSVLYERRALSDGASFVPRKVMIQARYGLLARRASSAPPVERETILEGLRTAGPEALIPINDPDLQQRFKKSALRMALWGDPATATEMAGYIANPSSRRIFTAALGAYGSRAGWPLRKAAPLVIAGRRKLRRLLRLG